MTATIVTAAIAGVVYAALLAGHWIGDYPVQRDADATGKAHPADELLAAGTPWHRGWAAIARHVASYLACQAAALWLITLVAPLSAPGACTALAISGATHAVIDRRWLVAAIIRAKGAGQWRDAPAHVDEALHHGVLLLAAVGAARIVSWPGVLAVTAAGVALIAAALAWERRHGHTVERLPMPVPARTGR